MNTTLLAIIAVGLAVLLIFTDPVKIVTDWYKKHEKAREARRAKTADTDDTDGIDQAEL